MHKILLIAPLCWALTHAHAHVTLENQAAPASTSYKATFRVGHGCGASPTRQLVVDIPAAMQGARPMPKPGWSIDIQRAADKVVRVTWTARTAEAALPTDHYDEFVLVSRTPAQAGPVYWPVVQVCNEGRNEWVQVPRAGEQLSDLEAPAALLEVRPAAAAAARH